MKDWYIGMQVLFMNLYSVFLEKNCQKQRCITWS